MPPAAGSEMANPRSRSKAERMGAVTRGARDGIQRRVGEGGLRELREVVDGAGGREDAHDAAHVGTGRGQLGADRADGLVGGARPLVRRLAVGAALGHGERRHGEQQERAEDDQRPRVQPPAGAGGRLGSTLIGVRHGRHYLAIHVPGIGGTREILEPCALTDILQIVVRSRANQHSVPMSKV